MSSQVHVAVIGAGPAGLMAAEVLAQGGAGVTVYDAMPSVGRKFLLAGRGGLNLTHSEVLPQFLARYGAAMPQLAPAIDAFPPDALREWSAALGQPTFIGTSGRVFPEAFKASPLLRAWLRRLDSIGVQFALRHRWTGWDGDGRLSFATPNGPCVVDPDATVLALGGASWPRLGSDGGWVETLATKGVTISPLRPANCGFTVAWSDIFRDRFEGQPLKGAGFSFGGHALRGEAVITRTGIEGGAIYALSAELRETVIASGEATLQIALRPDLDKNDLVARLSAPRGKQSFSNWLRKAAQLSPVGIGLLQEAAAVSGTPLPSQPPDTNTNRIPEGPPQGGLFVSDYVAVHESVCGPSGRGNLPHPRPLLGIKLPRGSMRGEAVNDPKRTPGPHDYRLPRFGNAALF